MDELVDGRCTYKYPEGHERADERCTAWATESSGRLHCHFHMKGGSAKANAKMAEIREQKQERLEDFITKKHDTKTLGGLLGVGDEIFHLMKMGELKKEAPGLLAVVRQQVQILKEIGEQDPKLGIEINQEGIRKIVGTMTNEQMDAIIRGDNETAYKMMTSLEKRIASGKFNFLDKPHNWEKVYVQHEGDPEGITRVEFVCGNCGQESKSPNPPKGPCK